MNECTLRHRIALMSLLAIAAGFAAAEEPAKEAAPAATPAVPAAPAAAPSPVKEYRSTITDGSYTIDASGQVHTDLAFEGEHPIIDMTVPTLLVVRSGMTLAEFMRAVADSKASMKQLSETEFQIGGAEVVIFVDGKLTRIRK